MQIVDQIKSKDGITTKFLLKTDDNHILEVSYFEFPERIFCLSSQIGCVMGCSFCASTKPIDELDPNRRFVRNLTESEILEQINLIKEVTDNKRNISNPILLSFMGMGEPFLNFENVVSAFSEFYNNYNNITVTMATSGIRPDLIKKLAITDFPFVVRAQFSLHAPNQEKRIKIMPSTTDIKESLEAMAYFANRKNIKLKVNYMLIKGFNDSNTDARQLAKLIEPYRKLLRIKFMVLNEFEELKAAEDERFSYFQEILKTKGIESEKFIGDGRDIKGTCGQARRYYYAK